MNTLRRTLALFGLSAFFGVVLSSCAGLSEVSEFLVQSTTEAGFPSETQATLSVEIVLLEPTPSPTPSSASTISQLLFVSDRGPEGTADIFLINSDGSGLIQLTNDPADDFAPAWSPDRQRIAFVSNRSGKFQAC